MKRRWLVVLAVNALIIVPLLLVLHSEAESAETIVEIGPSQVGNNFSNSGILTVSQRWNDRLQLTFGVIGPQEVEMCPRPDCVWTEDEQLLFGGEVLLKPLWFWTDRLKFGVGPYIKTRPDRFVSSFLMAGLMLEWRFTDHVALALRHWSNSSSGIPLKFCNKAAKALMEDNSRVDLIPHAFCREHDFNVGHDSWLRLQIRW